MGFSANAFLDAYQGNVNTLNYIREERRAAHRPFYGHGRVLYGSRRYTESRKPSVHLLVKTLDGTVRLAIRPFDGRRVQTKDVFSETQSSFNITVKGQETPCYYAH